jgi:hypothetical protein
MWAERAGELAGSRAAAPSLPAELLARLLDSADRPARFVTVTAAPLDCGAVSVWLVEAEICSPTAIANAGL